MLVCAIVGGVFLTKCIVVRVLCLYIYFERLSQSFLCWGLFCLWARPVGRARCDLFFIMVV